MTTPASDFRSLSVAERLQLVEDIWDSIALDSADAIALTAEQRMELQRRLDSHRVDPSRAVAWEAVRADLFGPDR